MARDRTRRTVLKLTGLGVTAAMGGTGVGVTEAGDAGKSLPEGVDPETISIDNGQLDVLVGETVSVDWDFEGENTLFFEFFALQSGGGPVVPSFDGAILDRYPETGEPGESFTAEVAYSLSGTTLNVERTVTLDPEEPRFSIDYTVRNVGAEPVPDLKLYEHCDYDIRTFFENFGAYEDGEDDLVYVKDAEETDIHAGFSGEEGSENHHVGPFSAVDEVLAGDLNNDDEFPDSGSADPVVVLQWALGDLPAGESTSFTVDFATARGLGTLRELLSGADDAELAELVADKRALIRRIRDGARPLVTDAKAATIDEAAESLLESVEDREFGDDEEAIDQYEEALERALAGEQLTETATRRPKSVSVKIVRAVVNAVYIGGVEAVSLGLGGLGLAPRVINWLMDFIGGLARGLEDVILTLRGADDVVDVLDSFKRQIKELFDSNPRAVNAASKNITNGFPEDDRGSFEGTIEQFVSEETFETLVEPIFDAMEETFELAVEAVYQRYYFAATLNNDRFALPSLTELEDAINDFEVDFPLFVPDFDPEVEELRLPDAGELDDAVRYVDSLPVRLGLITGIDPVVEREIAQLEDAVAGGDLSEVDDDVRELLTAGIDGALDVFSDASEGLMDFVQGLVDVVSALEFLVAVGIVIAGAATIATSGGSSPLLAILGTFAFYLAVTAAALSLGQAAIGSGYLVGMGKLHEAGVVGLLDDVGDVSAFGAGGGS